VLTKSLQSLLARVKISSAWGYAFAFNLIIGSMVPVLALLAGHVFQVLVGPAAGKQTPLTALSSRLPDLAALAPSDSPLRRVVWLLAAILSVLIVIEFLLYLAYRLNQAAAVDFEVSLIETLREHSHRFARARTLSAQETELMDSLDYHVPRVRNLLTKYWQAIPRHVVQFGLGILFASLIQFQFTLLAVIATALLVAIYQFLDRLRRTRLPVVREKASLNRSGLVKLVLRGPILEAVHNSQEIERRFAQQLNIYRRDAVKSLTSSAWKTPVVSLFLGALACLLTFVIVVQLLQNNLQLPSAFAFLFCLAAAVFSARRLLQVYRESRQIENAVEQINHYLLTVVPASDEFALIGIKRVEKSVVWEHVTLHDTRGRKLLEDVSVAFEPGQLIGIVATQTLESRALVEMLMGFGQPTSGRMLIDGKLVSDIKPVSLTHCSHWISADGAVLTGTIRENLAAIQEPVEKYLEQSGLTELINRLPDGLNTVITGDDDRLKLDDSFRLGLARGLVSHASVIVVEEPNHRVDPNVEQATLGAISSLVKPDRITIVLPTRLNTIRNCTKLVFIHDHRVLDVGPHAELIQRNELYRHLNYIQFNPYGLS
jgi:ATP-binding cassette, subfamily B, bacterial